MTLELGMITIDCADPQRLAGFWTEALGVQVAQDYGDFLVLMPAQEGGTTLGFQRVPEPPVGKNRVHLDLGATDRAAEVKRLLDLGAAEVEEHSMPGLDWTVLTDPEGTVCSASAATAGDVGMPSRVLMDHRRGGAHSAALSDVADNGGVPRPLSPPVTHHHPQRRRSAPA